MSLLISRRAETHGDGAWQARVALQGWAPKEAGSWSAAEQPVDFSAAVEAEEEGVPRWAYVLS